MLAAGRIQSFSSPSGSLAPPCARSSRRKRSAGAARCAWRACPTLRTPDSTASGEEQPTMNAGRCGKGHDGMPRARRGASGPGVQVRPRPSRRPRPWTRHGRRVAGPGTCVLDKEDIMSIRPLHQAGRCPQMVPGNGAGSQPVTVASAAERTVSPSMPGIAAPPSSAPAGQRAAGFPPRAGGRGPRGCAARPVEPSMSRPSGSRGLC